MRFLALLTAILPGVNALANALINAALSPHDESLSPAKNDYYWTPECGVSRYDRPH
jgi:hypothetical protein